MALLATTADLVLRVAWGSLVAGVILLAGATLLLVLARRRNERNWVLQRAPELPLGLVNVHDDVWVRGETRCDAPLVVPYFGLVCLAYRYLQEQKVEESAADVFGQRRRTRTRWEVRDSRAAATDFELVDGNAGLRIHADEAELSDLLTLDHVYERGGTIRHSATFLPHPSTLSALGCVGEGRGWLERHQNIPLLVTPRTRAEYVAAAARGERRCRLLGLAAILAGAAAAFYGGAILLEFPRAPAAAWSLLHASLALLLGSCLFVAIWTFHSFNTMLLLRIRARAAWRQIDVDLKNRADLVPRLVTVARAGAAHERDLQETVAAFRAAANAASVRELLALEEAWPALTADPLFQSLRRELTALEEKIAHDRAFFDACATEYNDFIGTFPRAAIAVLSGFRPETLFSAGAGERVRGRFRVVGGRRRVCV